MKEYFSSNEDLNEGVVSPDELDDNKPVVEDVPEEVEFVSTTLQPEQILAMRGIVVVSSEPKTQNEAPEAAGEETPEDVNVVPEQEETDGENVVLTSEVGEVADTPISPETQELIDMMYQKYTDVSKGSYAYEMFNQFFNGNEFKANAKSFMSTFIRGSNWNSKWDFSKSEFWTKTLSGIEDGIKNGQFFNGDQLDEEAIQTFIIDNLKTNFVSLITEIEAAKGDELGSFNSLESHDSVFKNEDGSLTDFAIRCSDTSIYKYLDSILTSL